MTPLRSRMIEDMQLHGLAASTQRTYQQSVAELALYYHKSPALISEEELRRYFLHLTLVRKVRRSTATVDLCGIKFFFRHTLQRPWPSLELMRPPKHKPLPVVLSRAEVARILSCVRLAVYRVCLSTIYSCGLRISEAVGLKPQAVDSSRMMLRVLGKGSKEREIPLPQRTLDLLRAFWRTHRSGQWLFPARGVYNNASQPLSDQSVQVAFRRALSQSGVKKPAHVHTLRHSYATHLLEAGVNLRLIQGILGHQSARTTALYTHLTPQAIQSVSGTLNRLASIL